MEPTTCPRHSPNGCYTPRGLQRSICFTLSFRAERPAPLVNVAQAFPATSPGRPEAFRPALCRHSACPDVGRERSVPRLWCCAKRRDTQSKNLSSIYHSPPLQIEEGSAFVLPFSWRGIRPCLFFVGARHVVPGADAWLLAHNPPRVNGARCGVRELAPAVCRLGLPGRAPRILYVRHSRLARCQLSAERRRHSERSVPRFWFCAKRRDTQSRNLSWIEPYAPFHIEERSA